MAIDKLECVDEATQREFSLRARRTAETRLRQEWEQARNRILGATGDFRAAGVADRKILSGVRVIERAATAVDRRVGLGR